MLTFTSEADWPVFAAASSMLKPCIFTRRITSACAGLRPLFCGAVVGLAAGGFGAASYFLHCQESAAPILLIWYSLGVVACGFPSTILGPRILRW